MPLKNDNVIMIKSSLNFTKWRLNFLKRHLKKLKRHLSKSKQLNEVKNVQKLYVKHCYQIKLVHLQVIK
jgi:hypothetical protein